MHGDVEVTVVVVVAGEEAGGVEGATHGEHRGEDVGVAQGDVECVIAAEAGAEGGELRGLILMTDEGKDFLHQVLLVLHVAGDGPTWGDGAVVPALGVHRVDTEELQAAVFELVVDDVDHAAVFKLVEAAAGAGKDEYGKSCVTENEELHVAPEGGGRPFVVFAFHRLPSASLTSYFTGAVF